MVWRENKWKSQRESNLTHWPQDRSSILPQLASAKGRKRIYAIGNPRVRVQDPSFLSDRSYRWWCNSSEGAGHTGWAGWSYCSLLHAPATISSGRMCNNFFFTSIVSTVQLHHALQISWSMRTGGIIPPSEYKAVWTPSVLPTQVPWCKEEVYHCATYKWTQ